MRVRTPGHSHSTLECYSLGGYEIQSVAQTCTKPRICNWTNNRIVNHSAVVKTLLGNHSHIASHIEVGAFVGTAEKFNHLADIDILVWLNRKRQFVHIHAKSERWSQTTENEELAFLEVFSSAIR